MHVVEIPQRLRAVMSTMKPYPLSDRVKTQINKSFTYHQTNEDQVQRHEKLRSIGKDFAMMVATLTPPSREQSLALTKIEEAVMHANAAIARHEVIEDLEILTALEKAANRVVSNICSPNPSQGQSIEDLAGKYVGQKVKETK